MQLIPSHSSRTALIALTALGALASTVWVLTSTAPSPAHSALALVEASDAGAGAESGDVALSSSPSERHGAGAVAGPGFYWPPVGRRFQMAFETSSRSRVRFQEDSGTATFSQMLSGDLQALVAAETEDELVFRLELEGVDVSFLTSEGPADPDATATFARSVEEPFWVRMDRFGSVAGYRFGADVDAQTRNLHRTLWSTITAGFTEDTVDQWTAQRADASGPFEMSYTWGLRPEVGAPGKIAFRKLTQDTEADDGTMEVLASEGTAAVDASLCWLTQIHYEESLRLEVPSADTIVDVSVVSSAELVDATMTAPSEIPFDWDAPWSPSSGARDADEPAPFVSSGALALSELGIDGVAQRIEELIQAGEFSSFEIVEAQHALKFLMLQGPEAVAALKELIDGGLLSHRAELVLLAAAGMAATPEAQGLLADTFVDVHAPADRRRGAAWSMIQLESPSSEVLGALTASVQSEDLSPKLMSTSLLILGAASSCVQGEDRESILETLLAEEDRARAEGRLTSWLNALGNAGLPETLPRIEPYFFHADPNLRIHACSAVRQIQGEEVTLLLTRALRDDQDEAVRAAGAQYLAPRNLEAVNLLLQQRFQAETSLQVLTAMVDGVGSRKNQVSTMDKDSELLLRNFANTTADASLRERALALINSQS